jgi:hypothetical protein
MLAILLPGLLSAAQTGVVMAQETAEMVTDRPDVTESALVVPLMTVQIESGFGYERETEGSASRAGGVLVRAGVLTWLEVRASAGYFHRSVANGDAEASSFGFGDVSLGGKVGITKGSKGSPKIAAIFRLDLPVGAPESREEGYVPSVVVAGATDLSDDLGIGVNIGAVRPPATGTVAWMFSTSLGLAISERIGLYGEIFSIVSPAASPLNAVDGGITYLLFRLIQLDASVGTALGGDGPAWFAGAGISMRIPS